MSARAVIRHDYAAPPEAVWALATDFAAFAEIMARVARFDGLPEGRVQAGMDLELRISLFGILPWRPWRIRIAEMDEDARRLVSEEAGMGARRWRHEITVEPTPEGCRQTDALTIEAGLLSPGYALYAHWLYRARHRPRLRLLEAAA